MNWFIQLVSQHSIAQTVIVYGCIIAIGILLGKVKIFNISLGITWVLFAAIIAAYYGIEVEKTTTEFLRDFGLILFVYSVGLQVGPGFFASLKKQALVVNFLAALIVLIGLGITIGFFYLSGSDIGTMTGIMSGAVTNTPGLGAATQAINNLQIKGIKSSDIGLAYAVAYPFGVVGIIVVMLLLKKIWKVNIDLEKVKHQRLKMFNPTRPVIINLEVTNPQLYNQPATIIGSILKSNIVISRMYRKGEVFSPTQGTVLIEGDVILFVAPKETIPQLKILVGEESKINLREVKGSTLVKKKIVVTFKSATHRRLGDMPELFQEDCTITRFSRSGIEFIVDSGTIFHIGDLVTIVGSEESIAAMEKVLGNSLKRLDSPELAPIFIGIVLGIIFGSIPFVIPGIPIPVKLGLAGGPLIVALLLSQFGNILYLNNYTTYSANLMLREIGIVFFLTSVGLISGKHFAEVISSGKGLVWMEMGAAITFLPLFLVGLLAKYVFRKTYFEVCGLLAGASTDPPALAFATQMAGNDTTPSVTYATVYPLTMLLRILGAQILILLFT